MWQSYLYVLGRMLSCISPFQLIVDVPSEHLLLHAIFLAISHCTVRGDDALLCNSHPAHRVRHIAAVLTPGMGSFTRDLTRGQRLPAWHLWTLHMQGGGAGELTAEVDFRNVMSKLALLALRSLLHSYAHSPGLTAR